MQLARRVIRAVTFDAAGTLIAPREPVGRTYARIARDHGLPADEADVERRFRCAFAAAPPLAFPGMPAGAHADRERGWWREIVRAALGLETTDARLEPCFDTLFAHYARAGAWEVYPDVASTLHVLRARGLRLGIVSNFDGRLPPLLDGLRLASSFDAVVWSSEVGVAKPAREIFMEAARRLDVDLPALCHVGDDPDADADGARAAGATGILLDRQTSRLSAVASLSELPAILADHA